jgi:hypothetical protein
MGMKDHTFKIYDPFARQRKKRTGVAGDFTSIYQEHVDKPMVASIVEARRRTDRKNGEWDEMRIEERAEYMDAQIRADAANAPRGKTPFTPRDFAAKYAIDLAELSRPDNKRHSLQRAIQGSEERQYQNANDALSPFYSVFSASSASAACSQSASAFAMSRSAVLNFRPNSTRRSGAPS